MFVDALFKFFTDLNSEKLKYSEAFMDVPRLCLDCCKWFLRVEYSPKKVPRMQEMASQSKLCERGRIKLNLPTPMVSNFPHLYSGCIPNCYMDAE